jgi:hypothetical protein
MALCLKGPCSSQVHKGISERNTRGFTWPFRSSDASWLSWHGIWQQIHAVSGITPEEGWERFCLCGSENLSRSILKKHPT